MTQTEKVLSLLTINGYVSNFYCIEHKITLRLSARINDLKKIGYKIVSHRQKNKDCIYTFGEVWKGTGGLKIKEMTSTITNPLFKVERQYNQ